MKELIESKWEDILSLLETEYDISNIMINTWIRTLKVYEVRDNVVYLYVDEKLGENALKFLKKKEFDIFLLSSIRENLNNSDLDIVIDEKKNLIKNDEEARKEAVQESASYKEAVSRSNLNPKFTFDTFIVGDGNRHAHATCLAVADMPGQDNFNPLFLYGNSGLGKTHLMQSIAHYILQKNDNMNVLYVPAANFTNAIIEAIKNHTTNEFREKYLNVDVLLIDDIQGLINRESLQTEFFNIFNDLYNNNKQIIITSDRPPKELTFLNARIRSRFECGIPIDIHEPDYETRMAILKNKAELDHLTGIPEEVYHYVAENVTNNIRELEGALNKIGMLSKLMKEEITLKLAQESLKDLVNENKVTTITPNYIVEIVSEHMGISADDIRSKKRSQDIALARQVVMYLGRSYTQVSLKSIGESVGGKDHTTVLNGIKRVEMKLKEDPSFKTTIDILVKKLNPQG